MLYVIVNQLREQKRKPNATFLAVLFLFSCLIFPAPMLSQSIDGMNVIKISSADKTAVIKTAEQSLKVIKVGDVLFKGATIADIADNKITIDYVEKNTPETVIISLTDEGQTVEHIKDVPEEEAVLYFPGPSGR